MNEVAEKQQTNTLREHYEAKIIKIKESYEEQIQELKRRVDYLKETNAAQRIMLEDALNYAEELEQPSKG
jgi:hypothetical protein